MVLTATVAKQRFRFDVEQVRRTVAPVLPEPVREHFVVIDGRRFPPKQVLELVTGLDRADFTTHQARRVLRRLGFTVSRHSSTASTVVPPPDDERASWPYQGREAELLRPYIGQWVAQRELEVLVAADTPQAVLSWLETHDEHGAVMFRVPRSAEESETWTWSPR